MPPNFAKGSEDEDVSSEMSVSMKMQAFFHWKSSPAPNGLTRQLKKGILGNRWSEQARGETGANGNRAGAVANREIGRRLLS